MAYDIVGDQQAVDKLLKQHPQAVLGIIDLNAAAGDWQQAIQAYVQ